MSKAAQIFKSRSLIFFHVSSVEFSSSFFRIIINQYYRARHEETNFTQKKNIKIYLKQKLSKFWFPQWVVILTF